GAGAPPPAGKAPDEPGVDRPEADFTPPGALHRALHVIEEPAHLGGGEVRIEHQARLASHQRFHAAFTQRRALGRGAPVLPDDRAMQGPPGTPIPQDGRLALVRDPERRHVAATHAGSPAGLTEDAQGDLPDLLRVVLYPTWTRVVLLELRVAAADNPSTAIEHEHGRTRGPLIDGDDARHGLRAS